ncbi:MAG: NAD(P)-dependent oxidoreductase [Acidobacteria bacterium ACB1]|nr:Glutamate synthase [NADPH] small chain [Pyrinomonadaceae bacterium]MCE7961185.1 NAD(P)-dependent oxidoreductase [Acidobacteria bacterium ACB1]RIJ95749.1 MAG: dihydropyrimidine dehydrogenase [Acidobacteriota bacterium]
MHKDSNFHIDPDQIERNFAEIHPAMTPAEAAVEANRCLFCFDAPCMHACPTHIDIPGFIKKIASGNLKGSARVIFDANPVGATCARVCPVEVLCEGACVENTLLQKPIEIGRLQRYATDFTISKEIRLFEAGEPNGKSIGIVGSGPAGLSCATYLARLGYAVKIYDKRAFAGGLDTYGMAEYKMPRTVSLDEVAQAEALGVEFILNTEIVQAPEASGGVSFADLKQRHDAIFLGIGLGATNKLGIAGEDLDGVYDALHFIEKIKTRHWSSVPLGKSVVVIGAGNTAVDAATQAKRLGAERVVMLYRRSESEMPAYDYEYELAKQDGIEFVWQAAPIKILSQEGVSIVVGGLLLTCEKTDGSRELLEIPCDMVIKAIGQEKMRSFFEDVAGVALDEKGRVIVNEQMQTSDARIFAGGDCVNGGGEAVEAAQMGKHAAIGIHSSLTGETVEFAGAILRDPPKAPVDPNPH